MSGILLTKPKKSLLKLVKIYKKIEAGYTKNLQKILLLYSKKFKTKNYPRISFLKTCKAACVVESLTACLLPEK